MLTMWVLIVFLAYFAALIGIAVFRSRQMQEMSDYVLAGRRVGAITSALSSGSSSTSGWTMLVFPGPGIHERRRGILDGIEHRRGFLVDVGDLRKAVAPVHDRYGKLPYVS